MLLLELMELFSSPNQLKVVSNFCNDVAKGFFPSTFVNPIFSTGEISLIFLSSLGGVILLMVFLYLAIVFSK